MPLSLLETFLAEELDDHVTTVVRRELETRTSGSRYFTFNVFNLRLDFDANTATIEDELEPEREETVPLDVLRTRLSQA